MNDIYDMLSEMFDIDPDLPDFYDAIDEVLYKEHETDVETFERIVKLLAPFTPTTRSPLTDAHFKGFVKDNYYIWKIDA